MEVVLIVDHTVSTLVSVSQAVFQTVRLPIDVITFTLVSVAFLRILAVLNSVSVVLGCSVTVTVLNWMLPLEKPEAMNRLMRTAFWASPTSPRKTVFTVLIVTVVSRDSVTTSMVVIVEVVVVELTTSKKEVVD